jgi:asparagine synthase (glutamine-hydrolysing)
MPGITGLISRRPPDVCRSLVAEMTGTMQHEKFHVSGSHSVPELGVFGGWTAMGGSALACQPVINERGDIALLLSGECFPDPDVRAGLKARGHQVGEQDASWLVHLYEERGDQFFADLNGLFSGLLIDERQAKTFLFNDRYGFDRVYYHETGDGFYFASEAKALLHVLPELRALDEDGLAEFLSYGCTLDTQTLFLGIKTLPAASLWCFTPHKCEKRVFFSHASWESQSALPATRFADALQETLERILPRYFESGPVGISLTAGLDSRMIMACRPQTQRDLVAYTFADIAGETLDARLAAQVADTCTVPHHLLRITEAFFTDFASLADQTAYITDGLLGASGAHEIFLNRQARELAPVRLTGNFGSEILRGMTTLKPLRLSDDLFDPGLRRSVRAKEAQAPGSTTHPVSFAALREIPLHLAGIVRAAQSQVIWRTPYMDNEIVALAFRAPDHARRSSSASLRVISQSHPRLSRIRTDAGLLPASKLSSLVRYPWHRASFKLDYWCGEGMPHWLSGLLGRLAPLGLHVWSPGRHSFLHYGRWFRKELAGYLNERLTDRATSRNRLWNPAFLATLPLRHAEGRGNYVREIDAVLTLEAIDRLLVRQAR